MRPPPPLLVQFEELVQGGVPDDDTPFLGCADVAARLLADPGTGMTGEPADVHLVDDGARGGPAQRDIPLPVVDARVNDDALHRGRGVGAWPLCGLA